MRKKLENEVMMMRLVKYLARAGVASRRRSEMIIREGRVAINGITTTIPQALVNDLDTVAVDGQNVEGPEHKYYLLLNKPSGYISTAYDTHGRPTVTDLIGDVEARLYPVGRLDADTRGALLLTNDGELAFRLTHPRYQVKKTYLAVLNGDPDHYLLNKLEKGLVIDGDKTAPARVSKIKGLTSSNSALVKITITEGRKRQVKKMFAAIGFPVKELSRLSFAGLTVDDLSEGSYRHLNKKEIAELHRKVGL